MSDCSTQGSPTSAGESPAPVLGDKPAARLTTPRRRRRRRTFTLASVAVLILLAVALGSVSVVRNLQAWNESRAAQRALDRGDLTQAREHLNRCLALWPNSASTHFQAAQTARRLELYDEAETHLRRCQQLGWDAEAVKLERYLARRQRGDLDGVERPLLSAVERGGPETELILEALCRGYMLRESKAPQLMSCLNKWLEQNPRAIQALIWRGDVRYTSLDPASAMADYQRALEIDPENDEARMRLAGVLFVCQSPAQAADHCRRVLQRKPENVEALLVLALCHRDLNQNDQAIEFLDRLLRLEPQNAAAVRERGNLALRQGQLAQAERWLRQSVQQDPNDKVANLLLYECLTRRAAQPGPVLMPWYWIFRWATQLEAQVYGSQYRRLSANKSRPR